MSNLQEMARLAREELMTWIQPVQLLALNPNRQTGEVSGRFRSSGMLFDYSIKGGTVSYKPVGSGPDRKDEAEGLTTEELIASLKASRKALQKGWSSERADSYLETSERLDAGKNCGKGYGCGSTCIDRNKQCRVKGGKAAQALGVMAKGSGGAAETGNYKGYDLSPPSNPPYAGGNAEVAKVTKALRDRIGQLEPAATRMMVDLAEEVGGKLEGLQYRLKAEKSLGRKIENEYNGDEFGGDIQKCAAAMSDVVRYTIKTTNEKYTDTVETTIKKFEAEGWNARVKNYWEAGQPYRGLNVALTSPDGLKVELQMHTPQSLYVKHQTHPLYEQYRVETNNKKRRQLFDRMVKITNSMIPPWGAAKIGGVSRAPTVQRIQMKAGREKLRLMGIGDRKVLGFQTAEEAGLVRPES